MRRGGRIGLPALLALATTGCGSADAVVEPARQWIVAIDLSGSQTPQRLEENKRFLHQLIDQVSFGDQIIFLEVHRQGLEEKVRRWSAAAPALVAADFVSSSDRDRLTGIRRAAHSIVPVFFDPGEAGRAEHTDLFSTLHVAAEYVRDAKGRRPTLVLLSDMLQSANGIEMQSLARMPAPGWVARQQAAGTLPKLGGVCVVVIGADPTTSAGLAVREFWSGYFRAAGAALRPENYRFLITEADAIGCG